MDAGKAAVILASHLFSGLDARLVESIASGSELRQFAEGEFLWRAGDRALGVAILNRGHVGAFARRPSGESLLAAVFGPRDSAGEGLIFSGRMYPVDAKALCALQVLWVSSEGLRLLCEKEPAVLSSVHQSLHKHVALLRDQIGTLSAGGVELRLATLFHHLEARFGTPIDGGTLVRVDLSRAMLAELVAARTETVVRVISAWRDAGVMREMHDGLWFPLDALDKLIRTNSP